MERTEAEVNIFLNDGALHVKAFLYSNPDSYGEDGTPIYGEPDTARTAAFINGLKAAVEGGGLTPGREKRSYGGGGRAARPASDPKPEGVPVPDHCGMPMNFKDKFTSQSSGKEVGARWVCAKDKSCEKGNNYGGFTLWHDAYMREING